MWKWQVTAQWMVFYFCFLWLLIKTHQLLHKRYELKNVVYSKQDDYIKAGHLQCLQTV